MSFNRKRQLKNPTPADVNCKPGTVVRVLTGRTRGKLMVLTGVFTDKSGKCMAYVADGVKYTVNKPKLKAASHLEVLAETVMQITDAQIKQSVCNQ